MTNLNQYDFVIYGSTGFTGKLVVEYAISQYGNDKDISWAIAGRNEEKLKKIKDRFNLPSDIGLMIVNNEPYLIEYNVRMGDPECQTLLPKLKTDFFEILNLCSQNNRY